MKSKLAKNGMITLPAAIRKQFGIQVGDEIGFVEIDGEYRIIPIMKMNELTNAKHFEATKDLIAEMRKDREKER